MSDTTLVTIATYLIVLQVASVVTYVVCLLLHVTGLLARIIHWLERGK